MRIAWYSLIMVALHSQGCTSSKCDPEIERIVALNYIDSFMSRGKMRMDKFDYYLVTGYNDNPKCQQCLDNFVERNKDKEVSKYGNYGMIFFKKSKQTTLENITANKKVIDRYSNQHDRIYEYHWSNGDFLARYKFRNGTIVEPKNDIRVEDTPKEKTGSDSTNIP